MNFKFSRRAPPRNGSSDIAAIGRPPFSGAFFHRASVRYSTAVVVVGLGFLARLPFAGEFGSRIPFVTLSPAVMFAAVLGGFGPGLLATVLASVAAGIWILPPIGELRTERFSDIVGLALFMGTGVFMSAVAGLYRESRDRVAEHDREQAVRDTEERIRAIANAPQTVRPPSRPPIPMDQFRLRLTLNVAFALGVVVLATVGLATWRSMLATREADQWQVHTYAVISDLDDMRSAILRAESATRGFVISGDPKYPAGYDAAVGDLGRHLATLRTLTADNPGQQQRLERIEGLIRKKLAALQQVIAVRSSKGFQAGSETMAAGQDEPLLTLINSEEEMAEQTEMQLLQQRIAKKQAEAGRTIRWVAVGAALGVIDLFVVFASLKSEFARRRRTEEELRVYQNRLRELVDARTRELRASEERLHVTLTSIGDAVMATDAECRVTFLNPVAAALTGWRLEEARGQPVQSVFRIINGETREPAADIVARVLREKRTVALANHTELVAKDGRTLPIEDSAAPILDEAGRTIGVVVVFHDVTERRRAQEALRESELRFRLALRNAPVSVAAQDRDFVFQWAYNQRTRRPDEIVGKTDADLFAPEDLSWLRDAKRRVLESATEQHVANWVTSNGRRLYLDLFFEPMRDLAGAITGVGVAAVDLTDQKRAEEQLRTTLESIGDGFFACDADWRFVYVNNPAERMLGIRREEVLGRNYW